jgi:hypothetical protein
MFNNHLRYFNTSGPSIREQHYTLEREALVAKGEVLVRNERHFTIWAPRQTGKSTYFRLLCEALNAQGYKAVHFSVEGFNDFSIVGLLKAFTRELNRVHGIGWELDSFEAFEQKIKETYHFKLVMIVDEIESLNPEMFTQFLHTIRNAYHSRQSHCLKSVILVGVANITGIIQDNASPFNIADNLEVDYFTQTEVFELLAMHETQTGQRFAESVKAKIHAITAGQPGLVNGFAYKLVEKNENKPLLEYEDYLKTEDWYLYEALDKNVANVVNKAKQYQKYMEELLFTEVKKKFDIDNEQIRYFHVNGIIHKDEEGNIAFWVPLYKKRLQKYFYPAMNEEAKHIQGNMWLDDYLKEDKSLNIDQIIREYQAYAKRRGFRYFIEKDANNQPK